MGIADIRNAFNAAADGKLALHGCTLTYTTVDGVRECQVLNFTGFRATDGAAFAFSSVPIPPSGDLRAAATEAAVKYLNGGE
jgi:hypothetical protein